MEGKDDNDISALIRAQGTYHKANNELKAKVRTQLTLAAAARSASPKADAKRGIADVAASKLTQWLVGALGWRGIAAGFFAGVALTMVVAPRMPMPTLLYSTEDELVADHVRSLRVGPLFQVESTDRHTVKPWFQGKLDYAPPVIDLADEGYPLLGARVEHINRESVATLVYNRRGHVVNLFVWPSSALVIARQTQVKGFNLVHWSDSSMQFWVVSDMDQAELQHFVRSLQLRRQKI